MLAGNGLLNLAGQIIPLAVGLVAIPELIQMLGVERFGILALIWLTIGYFSLFDFGLGKAITIVVARKFGSNEVGEIPDVVWTGAMLLFVLGGFSLAIVYFASDWLTAHAFGIGPDLRAEARSSIALLAVSLPIVLVSIGLRGVLEAYQEFKFIASVRIPIGVWNFVGPVIALRNAESLDGVVLYLLCGRLVAMSLFLYRCIGIVSAPCLQSISKKAAVTIVRFGGWLAISNVVGPLTAFMDRIVVAVLLPISAVSYYTTPHQVVTRILIVPSALLGAFFPAFATLSRSSPGESYKLMQRATVYVLAIVAPASIIIAVFAKPLLSVWVGEDFAENSYEVARLLGTAVSVNCVGIVAQMYIQAVGRPDITAKFSLIELPVFSVYLVVLVENLGTVGAGYAWNIRVMTSTLLLSILAKVLAIRMAKES